MQNVCNALAKLLTFVIAITRIKHPISNDDVDLVQQVYLPLFIINNKLVICH